MTRDVQRFGRVGVLAGGPSNEREVSLRSGRAVYQALRNEGVDAVLLEIENDAIEMVRRNRITIAFLALHGRFGEDGTVQQLLEEAAIPYTGSGTAASRCALDKAASKKAFAAHGIPTPPHVALTRTADKPAPTLSFPVVVKPQCEGSSIGLSVVREPGTLAAALAEAFRYDPVVIVEQYIAGRELTVGILNDRPLPVVEIVTKNKVYDYTAKYADPATQYLCPAPIGDAATAHAQRLAVAAHHALGCRSLSRVDMILDTNGAFWVLEVNTIPGMTERSLLPKAASAAGIPFGRLCLALLESALPKQGI